MIKNLMLPVYSVSGNNFEIGFEIGKRFRHQIANFLEQSKQLKLMRRVEKATPRLQKWMEYGEKWFPQYMAEIRGLAEGSNSNLTDILLINCKYDSPRKACTTVVFKESGRIILAHNEDNTKDNLNNCQLLKIYPEAGTPFMSFCYPAMLPGNSFAFNAHGVIITNNAMPTPDIGMGCPRHLIDRSQLEGKNAKEVIQRTLFRERASGGSFNIVSQKEQEVMNIETTSERHCITEVVDEYLHTNHYVSEELSGFEKRKSLLRSSITRYEVGSKLLLKSKEKTPQTALDILSSLEAKPYSIMRIDKRMRICTLFTALFDVSCDGITMKVYEPNPKLQEEEILFESSSDDLI